MMMIRETLSPIVTESSSLYVVTNVHQTLSYAVNPEVILCRIIARDLLELEFQGL
jgi:hypothetical protein